MLIEAENLSCGYDGRAVIRDISLRIGRGELWCVLGPNGVGKTTLFKTVLGLLKPLAGELRIGGGAPESRGLRALAREIAYVPQNHVPPFPFTVEEVVAMGRNPHRSVLGGMRAEDREAVDAALETLGIRKLRRAVYTKISGGERQLTLLARAIAQDTPVLVLDEPVSGLDFGNQARVIAHVCKIMRRLRKTVIMTTHCPDHALMPDSRVILLRGDGAHRTGVGREIVTEDAIRDLYGIENRIVDVEACRRTTCLPLLSEEPEARRGV